jgi:hypothetical protein
MTIQFQRSFLLAPAVAGLIGACGGKDTQPTGENGGAAPNAPAAPARKIGEAEYKAFNDAFKLDGFQPQMPPSVSGMGSRIALQAPEKPNGAKLGVEVTYSACDPIICPKLDLASVKANQDNMKRMLPPIALENPELVHEIFELDVAGDKVIGVYTLHLSAKKTSDGGTSKSSANSIDLTWHDNTNLLMVKARATDWGAESQAQLAERTPRPELEALARSAFEAAKKALPK